MKMACDCYALIFNMMRPLGFTQSWGVTVFAFNIKPVFTFIILHYLCDWCSCQTLQQDISFLQALVVSHGAILKMSHSIGSRCKEKKREEDFNEMISYCIYMWHDKTSWWYGNNVESCSFIVLAVLIHQLIFLSLFSLCHVSISLQACVSVPPILFVY